MTMRSVVTPAAAATPSWKVFLKASTSEETVAKSASMRTRTSNTEFITAAACVGAAVVPTALAWLTGAAAACVGAAVDPEAIASCAGAAVAGVGEGDGTGALVVAGTGAGGAGVGAAVVVGIGQLAKPQSADSV